MKEQYFIEVWKDKYEQVLIEDAQPLRKIGIYLDATEQVKGTTIAIFKIIFK